MWWGLAVVIFSNFHQLMKLVHAEYKRVPIDLFDYEYPVQAGFNLRPDYYIRVQRPVANDLNTTQDMTNVLEPALYRSTVADSDLMKTVFTAALYSDYDSTKIVDMRPGNVTSIEKYVDDNNGTYIEGNANAIDHITYVEDKGFSPNSADEMNNPEGDQPTVSDLATNDITADSTHSGLVEDYQQTVTDLATSVGITTDNTPSGLVYTDNTAKVLTDISTDKTDSTSIDIISSSISTVLDNERSDYTENLETIFSTRNSRYTPTDVWSNYVTDKHKYFLKVIPDNEVTDMKMTNEITVVSTTIKTLINKQYYDDFYDYNDHKSINDKNTLKKTTFNWDIRRFGSDPDIESETTIKEPHPTRSKSRDDTVQTNTKPQPTHSESISEWAIARSISFGFAPTPKYMSVLVRTHSKSGNDLVPTRSISTSDSTSSTSIGDLVSTYSTAISDLESTYSTYISDLESTHSTLISDLVSTHSTSISDLVTTYVIPRSDLIPIRTKFISVLVDTQSKSGSDLVPTHSKSRSDLVPTRSKFLGNLVSTHSKTVSQLVPSRSKSMSHLESTHYKSGSDLVPTHSKSRSDLVPTRSKFLGNLVSTHSKTVSQLVPSRSKSMSHLETTHSKLGSDLVPTHSKSRSDLVPTRSKFLGNLVSTHSKPISQLVPSRSKSMSHLKSSHYKSGSDLVPTHSKSRNDLVPTRSKFLGNLVSTHSTFVSYLVPTRSKLLKDLARSKSKSVQLPTHYTYRKYLLPSRSKSINDLVSTRSKLASVLVATHSTTRSNLIPTRSISISSLVSTHAKPIRDSDTSIKFTPSKGYLVPTHSKPLASGFKHKDVSSTTTRKSLHTYSNSSIRLTKHPYRPKLRKILVSTYTRARNKLAKSTEETQTTEVLVTTKMIPPSKITKAKKILVPTRKKALTTRSQSKVLELTVTKPHQTRSMLRDILASTRILSNPTLSKLHSNVAEEAWMYPMYPETATATITTTTVAIAIEEVNTDSTIIVPEPFDIPESTLIERRQLNSNLTSDEDEDKGKAKKIDYLALLSVLGSMIENDTARLDMLSEFNETLANYTLPTCEPTPTTPRSTFITTTEPPSTIDFGKTPIVAKCFVCGLEVEGIPYTTACADAFGGDFIPLAPVNAKSRGLVSSYRKYCHYLDVNRVITPPEEPQSVFGRFTGGCSVRWVDLSSVYTQRACRNRRRAVLGKHFASKRMAKLEMALQDVDNGCIISPMATLLPLSRSMSLYARFHACVCDGYWCNAAVSTKQWIRHNVLILVLVFQLT